MSTMQLADQATPIDILREMAVLAVSDFVDRHILGLWTLFEVVDNDAGLKACGVLITATDEALPDARCTYRALRDIRRALESVPNAVLVDREETGRTATETLASLGWYGARITDMERRLFRLS